MFSVHRTRAAYVPGLSQLMPIEDDIREILRRGMPPAEKHSAIMQAIRRQFEQVFRAFPARICPCGMPIYWLPRASDNGGVMPYDGDGNCHWATCQELADNSEERRAGGTIESRMLG